MSQQKKEHILGILHNCVKNNIPFAAYSEPGTTEFHLWVANDVKVVSIGDIVPEGEAEGFVFAPFDVDSDDLLWLSIDQRFFSGHPLGNEVLNKNSWPTSLNTKDYGFVESDFSQYNDLFKKFRRQIDAGKVRKAILSRVKIEHGVDVEQASELFLLLCHENPEAYTYMVNTPQAGLWMGASPELLFSLNNNEITTVSLAGTRQASDENAGWNLKEIDEQAMVTEYVEKVLHDFEITEYIKEGPFSVKAGENITHLKTLFKFKSPNIKPFWGKFIKHLHPTPAVCGLPKEEALELISDTEEHLRRFYGGFLGAVTSEKTQLFVNIRCMKFLVNKVAIFLGGGITAESEAIAEWKETELKAETLLAVIKNVRNLHGHE